MAFEKKRNFFLSRYNKSILVMMEKLAFLFLILRILKFIRKNMNDKLYYDVLQHQLTLSIAQMHVFFSTRPSSLLHIKYCQRKNRQFKTNTSNQDAMPRGKKRDSRSAYSSDTSLVLLLYSSCTPLILPSYSSCTPLVLLLYSSCTPCTPAVLFLYSSCTLPVLFLYSSCTLPVLFLYSSCTPVLLYSACTSLHTLEYWSGAFPPLCYAPF